MARLPPGGTVALAPQAPSPFAKAVLKQIEQQFFDIYSDAMAPDGYLQVSMKAFG